MAQPGGQFNGAQRGLLWHQFDLLAIEVITGTNLPVQRQLIALLFEIKGEGLIDRHELATAVLAEQRSLGRLRQKEQAAKQKNQFNEALIHNR
ncbi:hypothetical protein D3C85_1754530 [compost metagenome]